MARTAPFEAHVERYDAWFERHRATYLSELLAMRAMVPWSGRGLSIGVGTARFAAPLGVEVGIDPARAMLAIAARRGIKTVRGIAESLPFGDDTFDYAMSVTTICFVDDADRMMKEARRVVRPGGVVVAGFIDLESELGRGYFEHQAENLFYREARFVSTKDVAELLARAGLAAPQWAQTVTRPLAEMNSIEPMLPGTGKGAFVVVGATCL